VVVDVEVCYGKFFKTAEVEKLLQKYGA
jgi:hypothetical protein